MKNLSKRIEQIENGDAWKDSDIVVELKVKKPLDKVIPIRLQASHWQQLTSEAKELGIGPTTLARMWILERLRSNTIGYRDPFLNISSDRMLLKNISSVLTTREYEVMQLLSQGYPNRHIAKILDVDIDTIKTHINDILRKLQQKHGVLYSDTSNKETKVER